MVAMAPNHSPSTTRDGLSGAATTKVVWNFAVRFSGVTAVLASSCRSFALLAASVACGPANLADQTPGRPPRTSTISQMSSLFLQRRVTQGNHSGSLQYNPNG